MTKDWERLLDKKCPFCASELETTRKGFQCAHYRIRGFLNCQFFVTHIKMRELERSIRRDIGIELTCV